MKTCRVCYKDKPDESFDLTPKGNRQGQCVSCRNAYLRDRKAQIQEGTWSPAGHKPRTAYMTSSKASTSPSLFDLYWSAGFLEAEGHFSCSESLVVGASQKDPELVLRLQCLFGGTVSPRVINRRPINSWVIYGPRAHGVMLTLFSLMSIRRKNQILKVLGHPLLPVFVRPVSPVRLEVSEKPCIKCGMLKPLNAFGKNNGKYINECRECKSTYLKLRAQQVKSGTWNPGIQGKTISKITTPNATRSPTEAELHWIAGFLDGEGSFRQRGSPEISCPQVNPEPIILLQELLGGSVSEVDSKGLTHWLACGERAKRVVTDILPYLSSKRQEEAAKLLK